MAQTKVVSKLVFAAALTLNLSVEAVSVGVSPGCRLNSLELLKGF
jgi:hypothetical protein